jgi:hypothetical protein
MFGKLELLLGVFITKIQAYSKGSKGLHVCGKGLLTPIRGLFSVPVAEKL